jgi:hypothetical protein
MLSNDPLIPTESKCSSEPLSIYILRPRTLIIKSQMECKESIVSHNIICFYSRRQHSEQWLGHRWCTHWYMHWFMEMFPCRFHFVLALQLFSLMVSSVKSWHAFLGQIACPEIPGTAVTTRLSLPMFPISDCSIAATSLSQAVLVKYTHSP